LNFEVVGIGGFDELEWGDVDGSQYRYLYTLVVGTGTVEAQHPTPG